MAYPLRCLLLPPPLLIINAEIVAKGLAEKQPIPIRDDFMNTCVAMLEGSNDARAALSAFEMRSVPTPLCRSPTARLIVLVPRRRIPRVSKLLSGRVRRGKFTQRE
ncbi:hypothetical protein F5B17DRAFT_425026 [Nemania serpens]|nr:hypothetical protein F5B17DRAFT_425026 [Nemania serpens]